MSHRPQYTAVFATLTGLALAACGAPADRLTGPSSEQQPSAALGGSVNQSVSGNVTLSQQPDPSQPAVVFNYSFSATQKTDPLLPTPTSINGAFHFEFRFSNVNVVTDGSVACFFVVGNKARVAGVIDRTNSPLLFPIGSTMIWSVTDGDGIVLPVALPAAAPARVPDTASPMLRLPGVDPITYCLAGGFLAELPVLRGQVQVHSD